MPEPCEYCLQDPCDCPVFDIPDEHEECDDPICVDADDEPTFEEMFVLAIAAKLVR